MPLDQQQQGSYDKLIKVVKESLEHTSIGTKKPLLSIRPFFPVGMSPFNQLARRSSSHTLQIDGDYRLKRATLIERFRSSNPIDQSVKDFCKARTLDSYKTDMQSIAQLNELLKDAGSDEQKAMVKDLSEYMETLYFISAFYKNQDENNTWQKLKLLAFLDLENRIPFMKSFVLYQTLFSKWQDESTSSEKSVVDFDVYEEEVAQKEAKKNWWEEFYHHVMPNHRELTPQQSTDSLAILDQQYPPSPLGIQTTSSLSRMNQLTIDLNLDRLLFLNQYVPLYRSLPAYERTQMPLMINPYPSSSIPYTLSAEDIEKMISDAPTPTRTSWRARPALIGGVGESDLPTSHSDPIATIFQSAVRETTRGQGSALLVAQENGSIQLSLDSTASLPIQRLLPEIQSDPSGITSLNIDNPSMLHEILLSLPPQTNIMLAQITGSSITPVAATYISNGSVVNTSFLAPEAVELPLALRASSLSQDVVAAQQTRDADSSQLNFDSIEEVETGSSSATSAPFPDPTELRGRNDETESLDATIPLTHELNRLVSTINGSSSPQELLNDLLH